MTKEPVVEISLALKHIITIMDEHPKQRDAWVGLAVIWIKEACPKLTFKESRELAEKLIDRLVEYGR